MILIVSLHAQDARPKIGLALSGGGAKGFAHIGVLKVLEEVGMPIDYISGTSMGSVIGGLYAIGFSAADLEEIALSTDWLAMFNDRQERRHLGMPLKYRDTRYSVTLALEGRKIQLPSGITSGHRIYSMLNHLTLPAQSFDDFNDLPIPFSCVATDIVTGEAVVLNKGNIAEAIRASMAIPTVFTSVKIGDRQLVDGGLVRNLPAEDARKMGADYVISVDVSTRLLHEEELTSFLAIMNQTLNFQILASNAAQRDSSDIVIKPAVIEESSADFDKVAFFISEGEKSAREMMPQLQAIADSLKGETQRIPTGKLALNESINITGIETDGLSEEYRRLILGELDYEPPVWTSLNTLEEKIGRLYNTQLFSRMGYTLKPSEDGFVLVIRFVEKSDNLLRIGFRYDSKSDASLLLNTSFRNWLWFGSNLFVDMRLGGDPQFDLQYFSPPNTFLGLGGLFRFNHTQENLDIFEDYSRIARYRLRATIAEGMVGNLYDEKISLAAGLRGEYIHEDPSIAPASFQEISDALLSYFFRLKVDTYNKSMFPTAGCGILFRMDGSDKRMLSDFTFRRYLLDARTVVPLNERFSLLGNLFLGASEKSEMPLHYQFALGGIDRPLYFLGEATTFLGLKTQESFGSNVQAIQVGVQFEAFRQQYIQFRWNAGNSFDEWRVSFERNRFVTGWGVTYGVETLLGPMEFSVTSGNRREFLSHLNIGYKF